MAIANAIAQFGMNAGNQIQNTVHNALARNENNRRYQNALAMKQQEVNAAKAQQAAEQERAFFASVAQGADQLRQSGRANDLPAYWAAAGQAGAQRGFDMADWPEYSEENLVRLMGAVGAAPAAQAKGGTNIEKLHQYRDSLPAGDPRRAEVDAAITKATSTENPLMEQLQAMQLQSQIEDRKFQRTLKEQEESRRQREDAREEKTYQAEQKEIEEQKGRAKRGAQSLAMTARSLLKDNAGLEGYSDISGNLPTLRPKQKSWESKLLQLLSNLKIEDMEKMKGVLSDSDMKVIAQAASSIVSGGDYNSNLTALLEIVNKFETAAGMPLTKLDDIKPQRRAGGQMNRNDSGWSIQRVD